MYYNQFALWTCLCCFIVSTVSVERENDHSLVVETKLGKLRGINKKTLTGKTIRVFYKIPFAQPPVGNLRFKPPKPVKPWPGVLDCVKLGAACVQKSTTLVKLHPIFDYYLGLGPEEPSEDCLFMNVFVPKVVNKKLPVIVFVHGGAFVMGTANSRVYDPSTLVAEENVIVVTFNYRLSFFGFLYLGIDEAPGNMGLMDQGLALQFLQDHVENFGGDPQMVTFYGQSAGASSVAHHLHIDSSVKLYKRMFLQSGNAHMPNGIETKENLMKYAKVLADNIGCPFKTSNPSTTLKCLMKKDFKDLLDNEPIHGYTYNLFFKPVLDGKYVKQHPLFALQESSRLKKLEIMVGHVKDESSTFLLLLFPLIFTLRDNINPSLADIKEVIEESLGLRPNSVITEAIIALYTDLHESDEYKRNRDIMLRSGTDGVFLCPSLRLENAMLNANNTVYKYRFKRQTTIEGFSYPNWMGTVHGSDIEYIFGHPMGRGGNDPDFNLSRNMMRYFANFARTGNPNLSPNDDMDLPTWTSMSKEIPRHLILDIDSTSTGYLDGKLCKFWNNFFPKMYRHEKQTPPLDKPRFIQLIDEERII